MDLTVVVPTRNEAANIRPLVGQTHAALKPLGLGWELVFVDDSDDATPKEVRDAEAGGYPVRLVHRTPEARSGGLSGAVLAGFEHAVHSEVVAVMDGDLQHPPQLLAAMVQAVRDDHADIAVASRFLPAGGVEGLTNPWRRLLSQCSRHSVKLLFHPLRPLSDPLAGFFAFHRRVIEGVELQPEGFKILLEVLVRGSWRTVVEVPCCLAPRQWGASKAGLDQGLAFGRHVIRLLADDADRNVSRPSRSGGPRCVTSMPLVSDGNVWSTGPRFEKG